MLAEKIITRTTYSLKRCHQILNNRTIAVLGYGPQGRGQSLNLRDNKFKVCLGLREGGASWQQALDDGWRRDIDLFSIEKACERAQIIKYLLSDAGQIQQWQNILPHLQQNKCLYFSHGFGIAFSDQTRIQPPSDIDVVLVAPKGPGALVRSKFLENDGINCSFAVEQDYSGGARDLVLALGFGIGGLELFETTIKKEAISDLVGERCVLMGLIDAILESLSQQLSTWLSPIEIYYLLVEKPFNQLINDSYWKAPDIYERYNGWERYEYIFAKLIEECYSSVQSGEEAKEVIRDNAKSCYRQNFEQQLLEIEARPLWQAQKQFLNRNSADLNVRELSPISNLCLELIYAAWRAQYQVLRQHGHLPLESYNETVVEAVKSLYPLIQSKGMDWMFRNCSTTAQHGALKWSKKFQDEINKIDIPETEENNSFMSMNMLMRKHYYFEMKNLSAI